MTKQYEKMSVADALYTAARQYPGSVEALAARMGKSAPVLRSKLRPEIETHHVTLEEALEIIELIDGVKPHAADLVVNAIAYRLGRIATRMHGADTPDQSVEVMGLSVAALVGLLSADLAVAVQGKGSPFNFTHREADQLRSDIANALRALTILNDAVSLHTQR